MKLKKTIFIVLASILVVVALSLGIYFVGKNNVKQEETPIQESSVKLLSFTHESLNEEPIEEENKIKMSNVASEESLIEYQYIVLNYSEKIFSITIILDNPNDYHIFDLSLVCDDKTIQVLIDEDYQDLTSLNSINWKGDTNSKYTLYVKSESEDFLNTLTITNIFYGDRENNSLRNSVNLNHKENFRIYHVSEIALESTFKGVNQNSLHEFEISINDYQYIDLENIYFDNEKVEVGENNLIIIELPLETLKKEIVVDFKYNLGNDLTFSKQETLILDVRGEYLDYSLIETLVRIPEQELSFMATFSNVKNIQVIGVKQYDNEELVYSKEYAQGTLSLGETFLIAKDGKSTTKVELTYENGIVFIYDFSTNELTFKEYIK